VDNAQNSPTEQDINLYMLENLHGNIKSDNLLSGAYRYAKSYRDIQCKNLHPSTGIRKTERCSKKITRTMEE
jgi:hypothetical protein